MSNSGIGGKGAVKAGFALPGLKSPSIPKPSNASKAGKVGIPGTTTQSKTNPIKSAEQTHNKVLKDKKMKEAQSSMKPIEMIKYDSNGQWSFAKEEDNIEKSGYEGYTPEDNARRKAKNTGETTGIHTMDSIKTYGGSGPSAATKEAKEMRSKSKKMPVKVYSPEEIAEMNKPIEKTEGRTTTASGVSEMGIEVRRSDPKSKAYSKVVTPEQHAITAKEIAKENIKQTSKIHPKLPN